MSMDEVTQQNAALVEESAAAAEALTQQAEGLTQTMEKYRVGGEATAAPSSNRATAHTAAVSMAPARAPRETSMKRPVGTRVPLASRAAGVRSASAGVARSVAIARPAAAPEGEASWEEF
jgi:methyl-accepting chemotaxis protein